MSARDKFRECEWLAEVSGGDAAFVDQVVERLAAGQELYGDSWAWVGIRKLLTELDEESLDAGAWAVLADQALDRERHLGDLHREQIRSVLRTVAQAGARSHSLIRQAIESIDRARDRETAT